MSTRQCTVESLLIASDATSIKRVAYLARRAAFCRELTRPPNATMRPLKVDGLANPGDAFTKHLAKPQFKPYASKIYNVHSDLL